MRLLAAPSCFRIAGCAVAVPLSLPPYFPVLAALFDGFPKSWCALQHPTFSRSPCSRSLQVFACRFSPVLDRGGHAYGVSYLSGPPSSLGWLFSFGFPRAGVRMLAAPVTHRVSLAGHSHTLLQVQPALWANNPCLIQVAGGVHGHAGVGTLQVCAVAAPSV